MLVRVFRVRVPSNSGNPTDYVDSVAVEKPPSMKRVGRRHWECRASIIAATFLQPHPILCPQFAISCSGTQPSMIASGSKTNFNTGSARCAAVRVSDLAIATHHRQNSRNHPPSRFGCRGMAVLSGFETTSDDATTPTSDDDMPRVPGRPSKALHLASERQKYPPTVKLAGMGSGRVATST
jgi:hypothetical protein